MDSPCKGCSPGGKCDAECPKGQCCYCKKDISNSPSHGITHHCGCDYHSGGVAAAAVKCMKEQCLPQWRLTEALAEIVMALTDTRHDLVERNVKAMRIAARALAEKK